MNAHAALQAGLKAALDGHAPLKAGVTAVFDAPPLRAARPYALLEDPVLADWSTKDMAGREGRIAVQLFDSGEAPVRLRGLIGEAEAAIEAVARDLGGGWRVVSLGLIRSRVFRESESKWAAMSEWRVRMLRES
ncbi:DUF3168 domain-containing protein [Sphingomonas sp. MMS12-HWE2-04]|uniref:tail completion protein gp17 n=1 Tax=Sphingomonas sp. MMS12-HWE2-04 TaxID=3234199 RepID=UPI00384B024A